MTEKRVLTGDRPTGRLHLGHWVGSLQNRLRLQADESIAKRFYMVADIQALTDNYDNPAKVRENMLQVVIDNMACGLDPLRTTMFIQSMVPEIAELTVLFMNLVTVNRLLENPTVKTEVLSKGWNAVKLFSGGSAITNEEARAVLDSGMFQDIDESLPIENIVEELRMRFSTRPGVPAGFLCYPVSQAADILFARANLVPVGADQRPMIEQTNEIAESFNRIYDTDLFPHVDIMVGETARLVGIDGNAKMSKSLGNTIYLSSTRDEITAQVRKAFTCPSKIRVEDTVTMEELAGNVVFQYLDIFDIDTAYVADLKERYKTGKVGDMEGKNRLVEVLDGIIAPIRARRSEIEGDLGYVESMLQQGIAQARVEASVTMELVRTAMQIDYFG
jgi:tryptophanyl-tRNA synthetase